MSKGLRGVGNVLKPVARGIGAAGRFMGRVGKGAGQAIAHVWGDNNNNYGGPSSGRPSQLGRIDRAPAPSSPIRFGSSGRWSPSGRAPANTGRVEFSDGNRRGWYQPVASSSTTWRGWGNPIAGPTVYWGGPTVNPFSTPRGRRINANRRMGRQLSSG